MHEHGEATTLRREDLRLPSPYVAPATATEELIVAAFAQVFNLDRVGMEDEFYDLGGDSLTGEQLGMELTRVLDLEFPISRLFDQGSPRKIANALVGDLAPPVASGRTPVFVVHGMTGHTVPRPAFYEGLAEDQQLIIFELPGIRGNRPIPHRIEGVANEYVAQVQRDYPEGPVILASFCIGWLIALEMARQLAEAGRPVERLVLLDPYPPTNLEARYRGERGKLATRIVSLLLSGRWSDGTSPADFESDRALALRVRLFYLRMRLKEWRNRLTGKGPRSFARPGFDPRARSLLRAYARHYWPAPFPGRVDVLAAREHMAYFEDPTSYGRAILPNARVHLAAESHMDITGASGPEVARAFQSALDEVAPGQAA
ncbi:thioesterase domain-containing protein [Oceanicola sp. S124]|uniref:thioesterase domain-containing protein n=1 Tax=Oceanicola sp. S124 TaxID=1042378 RepID=UPI000255967E|nr:thioesterase domain-containing protein [Oceanicola sp. S124]